MSIDTVTRDQVQALRARIDDPALPAELLADGQRLLDAFHVGRLDRPDAVRLGLLLHIGYVRDLAWREVYRRYDQDLSTPWAELAMAMPPVFVTPAAFLSATALFTSGAAEDGYAALTLAEACDPDYESADLLRQALHRGIALELRIAGEELPTPEPCPHLLLRLRSRLDLSLTLGRYAI